MLTGIKAFLAKQSKKPSGWFGRHIASRVFNKENYELEQFGLELLSPQEGDNLLEIGFGNGRLINQIASEFQKGKVHGIDIAEDMVDLARKKNKKWVDNGQVALSQASVAQIPYPDASFGKIFTANTIYFWPEPENNLREVKRVLKPSGLFVCALRLKEQMVDLDSDFKSAVVQDNPHVFEHLYDGEEVKQLFKKAGFEQVTWQTQPGEKATLNAITGVKP